MEPKWWTNKPQTTHSQDTTQPKLGRSSPLFPNIVYIMWFMMGITSKWKKFPRFPNGGKKNSQIFQVITRFIILWVHNYCIQISIRDLLGKLESCNPWKELSNTILHIPLGAYLNLTIQIFVVKPQVNLIFDHSFGHKLWFKFQVVTFQSSSWIAENYTIYIYIYILHFHEFVLENNVAFHMVVLKESFTQQPLSKFYFLGC